MATQIENKIKIGKAVFVTALQVEYKAVRAHMKDIHIETTDQGDTYEVGTFSFAGGMWEVGIAQAGKGPSPAAIVTERAIKHFHPNLIMFVGVAGGIKDVELYDVVIAAKVYGYEHGKDVEEQFLSRPDVSNPSASLIQRARFMTDKKNWVQRIHGQKPVSTPRIFIEPIASGGKVAASRESDLYKFLRKNYSDAVAIEMEGFGFLQGAQMNEAVKALVIRSISDLLDNKQHVEKSQNSQEIAAACASAFAFDMLASLGVDELQKQERAVEKPSSTILIPPPTMLQPQPHHQPRLIAQSSSKDFRISFVKSDRFYALWIEAHLSKAGYSTLLHARDTKTASTFADPMDEIMTPANNTIFVLSVEYLKALTASPSWEREFRQEIAGHILPIIVHSCPYHEYLNGFLEQGTVINITGKSENEALEFLMRGLDANNFLCT